MPRIVAPAEARLRNKAKIYRIHAMNELPVIRTCGQRGIRQVLRWPWNPLTARRSRTSCANAGRIHWNRRSVCTGTTETGGRSTTITIQLMREQLAMNTQNLKLLEKYEYPRNMEIF